MKHLINKYLGKLESQRFARGNEALFLALDADLYGSGPLSGELSSLGDLFGLMNINSVLYAVPAEPYRSILVALTSDTWSKVSESSRDSDCTIVPMDTETRTFFHDIPVVGSLSPDEIAGALGRRKSAVVKGRGVVTYGVVTPEQAFVSFCSTCFSTFVKFFYDCLVYFERCARANVTPDPGILSTFEQVCLHEPSVMPDTGPVELTEGPPRNDGTVLGMIAEAGRAVVDHRLVDSYFGNISCVFRDSIFVSETGSSLDELEGCIDAVPLDGSSSVGITASSELSAHRRVYEQTGHRAILHGHPKFAVILSMHCTREECDRTKCHTSCREKRYVAGIPIVSGEIGTGPTGLMHTIPAAMKEGKGAIVYGHGVFTSGAEDFREPFRLLLRSEIACRDEYFRLVRSYVSG
jgi:ribulose-5-phosphate 4-epimerase/fuculose-1-phosphate aldolase